MRRPVRRAAVAAIGLGGSGCGGPHSAFADPASEAASAIGGLWWLLFAVTTAVFLAVMAGWAYALLRRRPGTDDGPRGVEPEGRSLLWILVAGGILPAAILMGLTVVTIRTGGRIAGGADAPGALLVEVVGHQFWWEARYPESGAITANEIHVPAGRPVRLRLTTNDVIHSIWIPRLHGKIDLIPGRTNELLVRPEEPGVYRGFCAEFCGLQHALMGLRIVAQQEQEFARWLAHNAGPAETPRPDTRTEPGRDTAVEQSTGPGQGVVDSRVAGEALFTRYDCHLCHRVRGGGFPEPVRDVGPDLTHVASRETLAGVTIENGAGSLSAWILDPHQIKPGVRMPATPMPAAELRALVSYLEGLR